jgi:Kdo2-lipid IVA lauroyltransferase/acyltransferase
VPELCYSFRPHAFSFERSYRIEANALHWAEDGKEHRISYSDVNEVRLYRQFMPGEAALTKKKTWRLHLHCRSRRRLVLSPLHYVGFRSWEDRSTSYVAFINALLAQLRSCNPDLKVIAQPHWTMRLRAGMKHAALPICGWVFSGIYNLVRHWNPDLTARAAGRLMRTIGPWLGRYHRVTRANLKAAFPDKSDREINLIVRGVWDNFGQVVAEYPYLDRLWDYEPKVGATRRIVIDPLTVDRLTDIRNTGRPVLWFAAHLANWELPPAMALAFGIRSAMLYRPPAAMAISDQIIKVRGRIMGALIPAGPGAARRMMRALRRGASVGMLVDQHFVGGVDVLFFGRVCKVSPTLARLARRFECPIYGARAVRLPDRRVRIELTEKLEPPRDGEGKIDVAGTMQMVTSIIEGWVREHPEQWLWMHRRWR